ncbi:hypothetical protein U1Q18_030229 [Sarracenia purpurea var. burkii]
MNTDLPTHRSFDAVDGSFDSKDACKLDVESFKAVQLRNIGHYTTEIIWLGSPWTCKKRRRHYDSFWQNGVKISMVLECGYCPVSFCNGSMSCCPVLLYGSLSMLPSLSDPAS